MHKCGIFHNFFFDGFPNLFIANPIHAFIAITAPVPGYVINTDECMDAAGLNV